MKKIVIMVIALILSFSTITSCPAEAISLSETDPKLLERFDITADQWLSNYQESPVFIQSDEVDQPLIYIPAFNIEYELENGGYAYQYKFNNAMDLYIYCDAQSRDIYECRILIDNGDFTTDEEKREAWGMLSAVYMLSVSSLCCNVDSFEDLLMNQLGLHDVNTWKVGYTNQVATDGYVLYADFQYQNRVFFSIFKASKVLPLDNLENKKTLRELLPCTAIAKIVRDELGLVSIDQAVTYAQLGEIEGLSCFNVSSGDKIDSLVGISNLYNLKHLQLYDKSKCDGINTLPDEFYTLTKLQTLDLSGTSITQLDNKLCDMVSLDHISCASSCLISLPEMIGNLVNLEGIYIPYTSITELPVSICTLVKLEYLDCEGSRLTSLPENIGSLTSLRDLDISNTQITSLPESIYNLTLDSFEKEGLDIE